MSYQVLNKDVNKIIIVAMETRNTKKPGKTWNYLNERKNTPHTSNTPDEVKHIKYGQMDHQVSSKSSM